MEFVSGNNDFFPIQVKSGVCMAFALARVLEALPHLKMKFIGLVMIV